MKLYFLSKRPCALFINGVYAGKTDEFLRRIDLPLKDGLSILFQAENCLPIHFFLTENIRFTPPEKVSVCILKDAFVIYANEFTDADFSLKPIFQKRLNDTLVSVFKQGTVQLSIQSSDGFFNATLPPSFCQCTVETAQNLFLVSSSSQLAVFDKHCRLLILENADSYRLETDNLTVSCPLNDCYQRTAEKRYLIGDDDCVLRQTTFSKKHGNPPIPYAFFESLLNGEILSELLADELVDEKEKIARFLGNFVAVALTEDINTCALIRKKTERLFEADYFKVQMQNDKITEITG